MFNDEYGLTNAVLQGRKTMTRRIIPHLVGLQDPDLSEWGMDDKGKATICIYEDGKPTTDIYPMYQPGETVAVAQSFKDLGYTKEWVEQHIKPNPNAKPTDPFEKKYPGWNNKMFVPAELNKAHQIRITNISVERLQDISDEDCLKEGVTFDSTYWIMGYKVKNLWNKYDRQSHFRSARVAFATLIDKVSGKGTWKSNPWVFAYEFELVKRRKRTVVE